MYAIPSIINVFLVILVFWLIFSIAGVTLFMGNFHKCVDRDGNKLEYDIVQNRTQCENLTETEGYQWVNAPIHFDNIFMGYMALFQVVCIFLIYGQLLPVCLSLFQYSSFSLTQSGSQNV